MNSERQKENIKKLIKVLEDVAASQELCKKFSMTRWIQYREPESSCFTSACALGWVGVSREFPEIEFRRMYFFLNGQYISPAALSEELFGCSDYIYKQVFMGGAFSKPMEEITIEEVLEELRRRL